MTDTTPFSPIRIYSTSWCPDCHRAKAFLDSRGVGYEEIDIEKVPEAADVVMAHNDGKRRVPTLVIDGSFYGNPPIADLGRLLDERETASREAEGTNGVDWQQAERHSLAIVGTGPAGLTAAIYAARADLAPLVLRGSEPGGQLTTTTEVENYPGFPEGITGPELMERFEKQAERFGAELRWGTVTSLDLEHRPFRLMVDESKPLLADSVILSTGASAKYLGLANEKRLLGRGVSACATCDGAFFRDKVLAGVGGGDTAAEEALFLTRYAEKVYLVHRRDSLRASKVMQDRLFTHPKIEILWNRQVQDILGKDEVEALLLEETTSGDRATTRLDVGGVFIAIGHQPNTGLVRNTLATDGAGYLITEEGSTRTSVPGLFACGDVRDPVYRQAVTAAGTGSMAALDAERWLAEEGHGEASTPATQPALARAS